MGTETGYHYSHSVGLMNIQNIGFFRPVDMAMASDGVMYVINRGAAEQARYMPWKRVTMCTADEEYLGYFATGGTGDGEMIWPVGIAVDRDDNVYISDEALQRISIFDKKGHFLDKWGATGKGDGQFDRPAGIAFDREDNLLVVDGLNNRIQRYSRDGRFLGAWGRGGSGDGEFNVPWGITVDRAGNVCVADWRNDRIQKFDPDGNHLATFGASGQGGGQFSRPAGVAVDGEGCIYVADWGNDMVQVLNPDGSLRAELRGEGGPTKWAEEWFTSGHMDMFEVRQRSDLEPPLEPPTGDAAREGSAAIEKLFWAPTAVKVDDQDTLYVVDTCRHRIQIYHKEG